MQNTNTIHIPHIDDDEIDTLKLVGSIDFLSDEENKQILENLKQNLRNWKHCQWYSLEEVDKKIREQFGF